MLRNECQSVLFYFGKIKFSVVRAKVPHICIILCCIFPCCFPERLGILYSKDSVMLLLFVFQLSLKLNFEIIQSQHKMYKALVIFFYPFVSLERLNNTLERNTTLFAKLFN